LTSLFDDLVQSGESGLNALITGRQQEHVQLDFKQKHDSSHGSLNDDDKRTLGEALSGFSNSMGGLLIWGIDARKGPDNVDCAQRLVSIANIEQFSASVTSLVGQLLMPPTKASGSRQYPVMLIRAQAIFCLRLTAQSGGPIAPRQKAGEAISNEPATAFFEMEHYDIEDAFNRTHVPTLQFVWRIDKTVTFGRNGEGGFTATITLQLRNNSTKTAKYPYLYVRRPLKTNGKGISAPQGLQGFRQSGEGDLMYFVGGADQVINPETRSSIAIFAIEMRPTASTGVVDLINDMPYKAFEICLEYKFGCEDSRRNDGSVTLTGSELLQALDNQGRS
jgi:hypothetical protein